ncbi:MAG: TolC family protein [Blastocatellia bacterium]|nr:TolC family protein [Blastocatellia bacterium]
MFRRLQRYAAGITVAALAAAFSATGARAQEPNPVAQALTLSEAVNVALQGNPAIQRVGAGRDGAEARLREARAGRWPIVSASERLTNGNNPVYVFGTLLEQGRFGVDDFALDALNAPEPVTNFRSSLDATVPVFDQFRSRTRTEQARLGLESADAERVVVEQRLRFEVLRAYFAVLVAEAGKGVVDEAVKSAEADSVRLRDMFDSGLVVASDMMAVDVQLAEYRQQQIQTEGDIAIAYATLATALGAPAQSTLRLTSAMPDREFTVGAIDELTADALATRPDYLQRKLELRSRDEAVRGAKGEYLPRVDAFASVGASADKLVNGSGDYAVGVSVTFNLFDAGRSARVDQARAAREIADAELRELTDAIRLDVVRAYREFLAARGRLTVAASAISQAEETLRIVRDRHETGLTTITEVLRAQTALLRARMNLVNARYLHSVGYGHVLLATGRLTDVTGFTR